MIIIILLLPLGHISFKDDDGGDNLVVNAQGDNPRNNHRKEKEKVYVSAGEWRMIMLAINHGTGIPADS
jgi:inorganic pyrophosphatase